MKVPVLRGLGAPATLILIRVCSPGCLGTRARPCGTSSAAPARSRCTDRLHGGSQKRLCVLLEKKNTEIKKKQHKQRIAGLAIRFHVSDDQELRGAAACLADKLFAQLFEGVIDVRLFIMVPTTASCHMLTARCKSLRVKSRCRKRATRRHGSPLRQGPSLLHLPRKMLEGFSPPPRSC